MPTNMASVYGRIGLRTDALTLSSVILPKSRFWKVVVRIRLLRIGSHAMEKVSFCKSLKIRMLVSDRHGAKTNGSEPVFFILFLKYASVWWYGYRMRRRGVLSDAMKTKRSDAMASDGHASEERRGVLQTS